MTSDAADILARLTPRQREAAILRASGYTLAQVGRLMGISAPAVCQLLRRARERMEAPPQRPDECCENK